MLRRVWQQGPKIHPPIKTNRYPAAGNYPVIYRPWLRTHPHCASTVASGHDSRIALQLRQGQRQPMGNIAYLGPEDLWQSVVMQASPEISLQCPAASIPLSGPLPRSRAETRAREA